MPELKIDRTAWKEDYLSGARARVDKLVREYKKVDIIAAATTDQAQSNYEEAMSDPKVLARRNTALKKLSSADLHAKMDTLGRRRYPEGVEANVDKASRNVEPYLAELERIVPGMKPRTRDPVENVTNRVVPIAKGLRDLRDRIKGAS